VKKEKNEAAGRGGRAEDRASTAGSKPGAMHGVGKETERPDLEQKIDESRGPGERTGGKRG
jgi:hypothetical protein